MKVRNPIRVLVIDDSPFSRRVLTQMLESSPLVQVVGSARDGEEALGRVVELQPDLVTLDLEMPRMGGFTFLRLLMSSRPTPVLVVSSQSGRSDVFKALELGAIDFIAKPTARAGPELAGIELELIAKVHAVRELRMESVRRLPSRPPLEPSVPGASERTPQVVAIAASTGGPAALTSLLSSFATAPSCAFLVAQHMPRGFTRSFAERLDRLTALCVREARGGEEVLPGSVLIAAGSTHLEVENRGGRVVTRVAPAASNDRYVPSADRLFESAAKHFGSKLLAVVLTGMGDDGSRGVSAVKACGGEVIAESQQSAIIYGMPRQAIRTGEVDLVLPLEEISGAIRSGLSRAGAFQGRKGLA